MSHFLAIGGGLMLKGLLIVLIMFALVVLTTITAASWDPPLGEGWYLVGPAA